MQCAIGGKGCCKKEYVNLLLLNKSPDTVFSRPCFGPFICYDYSNEVCKPGDTTVEAFQCCPASAPWCLFDPENGYGCFVKQELLTYTKEATSVLATTNGEYCVYNQSPSCVLKESSQSGHGPHNC